MSCWLSFLASDSPPSSVLLNGVIGVAPTIALAVAAFSPALPFVLGKDKDRIAEKQAFVILTRYASVENPGNHPTLPQT